MKFYSKSSSLFNFWMTKQRFEELNKHLIATMNMAFWRMAAQLVYFFEIMVKVEGAAHCQKTNKARWYNPRI